MLFSLAVIFLCGMLLGGLCKKLKLPPLLGMLLTGILLGPHALDVLDGSILAISADLRRIALIIILTRAGLNLELADLKRAGRPAVLLCFVPACFEIAGMVLLAPRLLGISVLDAAIMGSVVAAVSPAVIVPKMLRLMEEGRGTRAGIPQMIMAGASVDDVFVIVLFTAFTGLADGGGISAGTLARIPFSIVLGILAGAAACGFCVPAAVYGVSVLHLFYAAENGGTGNAAAAAPWVQDHAGRGMETVLPAAGRQAHALCAGGKSIGRGTREYR